MTVFVGTTNPDVFVGSNTNVNEYRFALGTLSLADIIVGGSADDTITLSGAQSLGDFVFANVTGVEKLTLDNFNTTVVLRNSLVATANNPSLYAFIVRCGNANNAIDASGVTSTRNIWLLGGTGRDTFLGSNGNGSQLDGGAGNDTFTMGTGTEFANGGDDNDLFQGSLAQLTGDDIDGGLGLDTLNISAAGNLTITIKNLEIINLAAGANTITFSSRESSDGSSCTINGTSGNDTVTVASLNDGLGSFSPESHTISGGSGVDTLTGGAGDDVLLGQSDNDVLVGGDGNDRLDGGDAVDSMSGGNGNDTYDNVTGNDTIIEQAAGGSDTIRTALVNYTMALNTEILVYTGTLAVQFFGNGSGNTIGGSGFGDTIEGRDGDDTLNGLGGIDNLFGNQGNDTLNGNGDVDFLYGGIGNDTLNGGAGNDELYGNEDNDTLNGGGDTDQLFGGLGVDTLNGDEGLDTLRGGNGNDTLNGGNGVDVLYGEEDDDILSGGAGADELWGGLGIDTADYSTSTGPVSFDLSGVVDRVAADNGTDLVHEVEEFVGSNFADIFVGDGADNIFHGGDGNDTGDYRAEVNGLHFDNSAGYVFVSNFPFVNDIFSIGRDQLYSVEEVYGSQADDRFTYLAIAHGAGGNDTFLGDGGINIFYGDQGSDTVVYGNGLTLNEFLFVNLDDNSQNMDAAAGDVLTDIENVTYTGTEGAVIYGGHLDNVITTDSRFVSFNDLHGGGGDDTFISSAPEDSIYGDAGFDTVVYTDSNAAVTLNLTDNSIGFGGTAQGDHFESIENATGSGFADRIDGSAADNTIEGGAGGDTLNGGNNTAAGDTLSYAKSGASVTVNLALNTASGGDAQGDVISNFENITGSAYDDRLTGSSGINVFRGGNGNDLFYVDTAGDIVIEGANGGTADRVLTSVSYALGVDQQIELFSTTDSLGTSAINLTGNNLADVILGNNGSNRLDGGGGIDQLTGQNGDDFYYVDNALDTVIEVAGGGTGDRVLTTVNYTLAVDQQVELLSTTDSLGVAAINITGNNLNNTILGNNGANVLTGGGGADRMTGQNGNDSFFVDNALDTVIETANGGIADRVYTTVDYTLGVDQQIELFTTTNSGLTAAINLTGNNVANVIVGNNGVNIINGGLANDALTGGGAADKFLFNTAITGGANVDTIADFLHATDDIQLAQSVFTNIGGTLNANELRLGTSATLSTERLVYDSVTGNLFFDADGSGATAQVQFAKVTAGTVLDINDFIMV